VVGLVGISRDLGQRGGLESQYEPLRLALDYLNTHYAENVRMQTLLDITGFSLSKLERDTLGLYLYGYSYQQIADHLQITTKSVDNAIQRVKKKLEARLKEMR